MSAIIAAKRLKRTRKTATDSAALNARQHGEGRLVWIMKSENVQIAESNSPQTNIQNNHAVQLPAQTPIEPSSKIKSIKYIGKENVYNMEVDVHHCFSVNGGLIVHNCIDALRYAYEDEMESRRVTAERSF